MHVLVYCTLYSSTIHSTRVLYIVLVYCTLYSGTVHSTRVLYYVLWYACVYFTFLYLVHVYLCTTCDGLYVCTVICSITYVQYNQMCTHAGTPCTLHCTRSTVPAFTGSEFGMPRRSPIGTPTSGHVVRPYLVTWHAHIRSRGTPTSGDV